MTTIQTRWKLKLGAMATAFALFFTFALPAEAVTSSWGYDKSMSVSTNCLWAPNGTYVRADVGHAWPFTDRTGDLKIRVKSASGLWTEKNWSNQIFGVNDVYPYYKSFVYYLPKTNTWDQPAWVGNTVTKVGTTVMDRITVGCY